MVEKGAESKHKALDLPLVYVHTVTSVHEVTKGQDHRDKPHVSSTSAWFTFQDNYSKFWPRLFPSVKVQDALITMIMLIFKDYVKGYFCRVRCV